MATGVETPQIMAASYTSTTTAADFSGDGGNRIVGLQQVNLPDTFCVEQMIQQLSEKEEDDMATDPGRRLIRVFIVDPEPDVPLNQCLIYKGDEIITESTNQELFFDIPIVELLKKHNVERVKIEKEDSAKEKPELLKPARIRDLKMVVVDLATF